MSVLQSSSQPPQAGILWLRVSEPHLSADGGEWISVSWISRHPDLVLSCSSITDSNEIQKPAGSNVMLYLVTIPKISLLTGTHLLSTAVLCELHGTNNTYFSSKLIPAEINFPIFHWKLPYTYVAYSFSLGRVWNAWLSKIVTFWNSWDSPGNLVQPGMGGLLYLSASPLQFPMRSAIVLGLLMIVEFQGTEHCHEHWVSWTSRSSRSGEANCRELWAGAGAEIQSKSFSARDTRLQKRPSQGALSPKTIFVSLSFFNIVNFLI